MGAVVDIMTRQLFSPFGLRPSFGIIPPDAHPTTRKDRPANRGATHRANPQPDSDADARSLASAYGLFASAHP